MKKFLIIILLIVPFVCGGQDTATQVFKIRKIYATAAGRTFDTIDRQELIDSGGIMIHGCPDCKVLGFQFISKTRTVALAPSGIVKRKLLTNQGDTDLMDTTMHMYHVINMSNCVTDSSLFSKNDLFTPKMKKHIGSYSRDVDTYYIEITNIKIKTLEGQEMTLDKICLFLSTL